MHSTFLFFDKDCKPTPTLCELLTRMKLEHNGTLTGIRDATQNAWYQAGKLRDEIKDQVKDEQLSWQLGPVFEKLGMVKAVHAQTRRPRYSLLLGAMLKAVRKRIAHLCTEWETERVRFKKLVYLGSERPLDPEREPFEEIQNPANAELPFPEDWPPYSTVSRPHTEVEMMRWLGWQSLPVVPWGEIDDIDELVITPGRANTRQTVQEWLSFEPEPGSCLVVSSQPFVLYEAWVVEKTLRQHHPEWSVDGIGYAAPPTTPMATYLDNVAKVIYEIAEAMNV